MENLDTNSWLNSSTNLFNDLNSDLYNNKNYNNYSNSNGAFEFYDENYDNNNNNKNIKLDNFLVDDFDGILNMNSNENDKNIVNIKLDNEKEISSLNSINWDELILEPYSNSNLGSGELSISSNNEATGTKYQIIEKQRKLEEALKKQEEINNKLEEQLRRSQMKSDLLTNKTTNSRIMLSDISSSSKLNSTPSKKVKGSSFLNNKENFNFTASGMKPKFQQSVFLEPKSSIQASVNGSPRRRKSKSKSISEKDRESKFKINFTKGLTPSNSISNKEIRLEAPLEPASIPDSPYEIGQSPILGLGLNLDSSRRSSISPSESTKLFGSSNEGNNSSPVSSPMKQPRFLYEQTQVRRLSTSDSLLFNNPNMTTPQLGHPSMNLSPVMSIGSSPIGEEPESQFNIAQTPSPVLKSQGRFEGHSPQFGTHGKDIDIALTNSPLKITRKLTTLPRGSIDRYVKELPDKLFECLYPSCNKTFKRRYNIRSHIQTHLEDRPYNCDFEGCDKAFVRNHDLVRHKKSHMEKRYACPCGKKFNREDALIVHRSRLICIGGKQFENVVIKRSPRKRGRPRKEAVPPENMSPTKKLDRDGSIGINNTNKFDVNTEMNFYPIEDQTNRNLLSELETELRMSLEQEGQFQNLT